VPRSHRRRGAARAGASVARFYLGGYSLAKIVPGGNLTLLAASAAQSGGRLQAAFRLLLPGSAAALLAAPLDALAAGAALTEAGALVPHKGEQARAPRCAGSRWGTPMRQLRSRRAGRPLAPPASPPALLPGCEGEDYRTPTRACPAAQANEWTLDLAGSLAAAPGAALGAAPGAAPGAASGLEAAAVAPARGAVAGAAAAAPAGAASRRLLQAAAAPAADSGPPAAATQARRLLLQARAPSGLAL